MDDNCVLKENWGSAVTSNIGTFIGVGGVLVGLLFSYYFYRNSLKLPALLFSIQTRHLFSRKQLPKGVEISLDGTALNNLFRCRIRIWNAGNTTIAGEDISASDPLRIALTDGVEWVSLEGIDQSSQRNNFCVLEENGQKLLRFEILEPEDQVEMSFLFLASDEFEESARRLSVHMPDKVIEENSVELEAIRDELAPPAARLIGSIKGIRQLNYIETGIIRKALKLLIQPTMIFLLAVLGGGILLSFLGTALFGTYQWIAMFFKGDVSPWRFDLGRYPAVAVALVLWGLIAVSLFLSILNEWIEKPNNPPSKRTWKMRS